MIDILVLGDSGYKIFWNNGGSLSNSTLSNTACHSGNTLTNQKMVRQGDFNGDGLPDFLTNASDSPTWNFFLGYADGEFRPQEACQLQVYDQSATSKDDSYFHCEIYDIDGDGKSDAVITKAMFDSHSDLFNTYYRFNQSYTYWMLSNGTHLVQHSKSTSNKEENALEGHFMLGDFNGDGIVEMAHYGSNCYNAYDTSIDQSIYLFRNNNHSPSSGKVETFTDGLHIRQDVEYAVLTNGVVYGKTQRSQYPLQSTIPPMAVVSTVSETDGAAGTITTNYAYKDLTWHLHGRGILGFSAIKSVSPELEMEKQTIVDERDVLTLQPLHTTETQILGADTSSVAMQFATSYYAGTRAIASTLKSEVSTDFDGNITTSVFTYDAALDNSLVSIVEKGFDGAEKRTYYGSYVKRGLSYLPGSVVEERHHPDYNQDDVSTTVLQYDDKGRIASKTCLSDTPFALTTNYSYDLYGNVSQEITTGNGISPVKLDYEYDNQLCRLLLKRIENDSLYTFYKYNVQGQLEYESDHELTGAELPLLNHRYNMWDDIISTMTRAGLETTFTRVKSGGGYYVTEEAPGRPWQRTWFDGKGRIVSRKTVGQKGNVTEEYWTLNHWGKPTKKRTYKNDNLQEEHFTYDARGRLLTEFCQFIKDVSYEYGKNSISITDNGKHYTKTFDSWGNTKTSTGPVSSVSYKYHSNGKPSSVTSEGTTILMEYDEAGNQTKLIDPDAGTQTYVYVALGRITRQTNGKGIITINSYNTLGQLVRQTTAGKITNYTYGDGVNNKGLVVRMQKGDYWANYEYDDSRQLKKETRHFANANRNLATETAYYGNGLVAWKKFPNGLEVSYNYDDYGFLESMYCGDKMLYKVDSQTFGESIEKLGIQLYRYNEFDIETGLSTVSFAEPNDHPYDYILPQEYEYGIYPRNLIQRRFYGTEEEAFTYDDADRLTSVKVGHMSYDGTSTTGDTIRYQPNGNIDFRKEAGCYFYESSRPHAVTRNIPSGATAMWARPDYDITYNELGKLSKIEDFAHQQTMEYFYGPDGCRWESSHNGIYFGDYEERTVDGDTKCFTYLDGGVLCITNNAGQHQFYYMFADHLGSIREITDEEGNSVFLASYNAWGKPTVTRNDIGFFRGYTGHEMLPEFGLINTNGRMYDYEIARFLSPDNYVQMPDNSQSFNRYSYCLNNPLKYTDPDGEMWWLPVAIGAALGAYNGGVIANNGTYNPLKWDYNLQTIGFMGSGAIMGSANGFIGGVISTSGVPMANTLNIAASSLINSVGTWGSTGGKTPISISFGAVSYDFTNKSLGYFGKRGNRGNENLGYLLESMAVVSDLLMGFKPKGVDLVTEYSNHIGHSAIVEENTFTYDAEERFDINAIISVGLNLNDPKSWLWKKGVNTRPSHSAPNEIIWRQNLKVNMNTIRMYSNWLNNMENSGRLIYSVALSSCVTHTSIALNLSGIFNIGIHPFLLNAQMYLWSNGIRPWTFSSAFKR